MFPSGNGLSSECNSEDWILYKSTKVKGTEYIFLIVASKENFKNQIFKKNISQVPVQYV